MTARLPAPTKWRSALVRLGASLNLLLHLPRAPTTEPTVSSEET